MSTPHSGAPPGADVKRATGAGSSIASGIAVGAVNHTLPSQGTQRLSLPEGASLLLAKRTRRLRPSGSLFITTDRHIGKRWAWRIVIDKNDDLAMLDLSVVTDICCLVAGHDAARIDAIVQAVIGYAPRSLATANYQSARIAPVLSDHPQTA